MKKLESRIRKLEAHVQDELDLPASFEPVKIKKKITEKVIEDAVCRYARSKGFTAEKFSSPNVRAVPDRMMTAFPGLIFFIEFKAPGKKVTPAQARDHERRRNNGFGVSVIDDIEEGKRVIDDWVNLGRCVAG